MDDLTKDNNGVEDTAVGDEETVDVDDLSNFREQWKRELGDKSGNGSEESSQDRELQDKVEDQEDDVHIKARELFLQGVKCEENGKLYEAIRYYKRAEKLVPNIEYQTFDYTGKNFKVKEQPDVKDDNGNITPRGSSSDNEEDDIGDLAMKFAKMDTSGQTLIKREFESNMTHIGSLPSEVLNYILKWVISSDLDFKSLENCSEVCRGFYLASRDEEIWRLICFKTWGTAVATSNYFPTWREMFLSKPRVHFSGCYISKMSYIRAGERGFQDHDTYKAWHVVEYYRFLRFFPGGQVVMVTSADDEAIVTKQLNTKAGFNLQGAMVGDYKIVDNVLVCVLHKPADKKKKVVNKYRRKGRRDEMDYFEVPEQDYHLEFYIKGERFRSLHWKNYNIVSKFKNGREKVDQFDLRDQRTYPMLNYKLVGSYHFESNNPLK
eukprot:GFUD01018961.1.p1 GENE.GFUD01018961.1~~GFUD01018961.1.p1  ORF type:complete len:435 (+),score=105.28 GFUD01018961.1:189-1493(+)